MRASARHEERERKDRYSIAVVTHALRLLSAVGRGGISNSEAARLLGTSRSSAYRLLVTLEAERFAFHDVDRREWLPGPALLALGSGSRGLVLRGLALPGMRRLHEEENETVNLGQYLGGELTYVEILESNQLFRTSAAPGQRANLHSTALGKAILAALPDELLRSTLGSLQLEPTTPLTRTNVSDLLAEIEVVRERGWSEEHGEDSVGVGCVGAAVVAPDGSPVGGLSVSAPQARLDAGRAATIGKRVSQEVAAISHQLV